MTAGNGWFVAKSANQIANNALFSGDF